MAKPLTFRLVAQDDDGQKALGQPVSIVLPDGTPIKAYIDQHAGGGATIVVATDEDIQKLLD